MKQDLDRADGYDLLAATIRAAMGFQSVKQKPLARKLGISSQFLNGFLCRKLNLLPRQIRLVLIELKIVGKFRTLQGRFSEGVAKDCDEITKALSMEDGLLTAKEICAMGPQVDIHEDNSKATS